MRCFASAQSGSRPAPSCLARSRVHQAARRTVLAHAQAPETAVPSFHETALSPVLERGELVQFPSAPGVYAVFDASTTLQYIGLSRKIDVSISNHLSELPELTHAVKALPVPQATREALTAAWKQWVEEAVAEYGTIPPGNAPGETRWQTRTAKPPRPEIRLTNGKGITGFTIEQLVDKVVKDVKVVAFVKGTRTQPQCGFSHKMLTMLNQLKAEYEVVNVLDEVYNPGLRDAIKNYSQWPTIPQLYINGEFVGGSDITEQLFNSGELQQMLPRKQQEATTSASA